MSWDISQGLCNDDLFVRVRDEVSGAVSFVLRPSGGQMRQTFYLTNDSLTDDGRYLWFYAFNPPGGDANFGRHLGVADLQNGRVRSFPETAFLDASPVLSPDGRTVYWCNKRGIYCRHVDDDASVECLGIFPEELHRKRLLWRTATHLTWNASRTELNFDAQLGASEWIVGSFHLADRRFEVWQRMQVCYNHGQFSPVDDNRMLIAQDNWTDPNTGQAHCYANRLWVLDRGSEARAIFANGARHGHEWWGADGKHVWYIDYEKGTCRVDINTAEPEVVWAGGRWHSHCSRNGRLLAGDHFRRGDYPFGSAMGVTFYNADSQREVTIRSSLPDPEPAVSAFHIHPHPRFSMHDRCIAYTTQLNGVVCPALTETDVLLTMSRS